MLIRETQLASCPPSAVIEFAAAYFEAHDVKEPGSKPLCRVVLDRTDGGRVHDALELNWSRNATFLLRRFSGSLTVRSASVDSTLTLAGDYDVGVNAPLTPLDAATVAIAGKAMYAMLNEIVSYVEAEWERFRDACPTIAMCNAATALALL